MYCLLFNTLQIFEQVSPWSRRQEEVVVTSTLHLQLLRLLFATNSPVFPFEEHSYTQWEKKHFNFVYIVLVLNGRKYQVSDEYWTRSKTFTSIFHCKVMFEP